MRSRQPIRRSRYAAISYGLAAVALYPIAGNAATDYRLGLDLLPLPYFPPNAEKTGVWIDSTGIKSGKLLLAQGTFPAPVMGGLTGGAGGDAGNVIVPPVGPAARANPITTRSNIISDEPFSGLLTLRDQLTNTNAPVWVVVPAITAELFATDNVDHSRTNKRADVVAQIAPSLSIGAQSLRLQGQLFYSAMYRRSLTTSLQSRTSHYAVLSSTASVLPDLLSLDLQGSARELAREGSAISDPILLSDREAVQLYSYSASPHIDKRVGDIGSFSLRYSYGQVWFQRNTSAINTALGLLGRLSDSQHQIAQATFQMPGTLVSRLSTTFNVSGSDFTSEGSLGTLKRAEGTVKNEYQLTGSLTAVVSGGYETAEHEIFPLLNRRGETWDVGAIWRPNPDNSLTLLYGRHFAINGLSGSWLWRISEVSSFEASYTDGLDNQQMSIIGHAGGSGLTSGLSPSANAYISGYEGFSATGSPTSFSRLGSDIASFSSLGSLDQLNRLGSALLQGDNTELYGDDIFRRKLFITNFNFDVMGESFTISGSSTERHSLVAAGINKIVANNIQFRWHTFIARDVAGRAEVGWNQIDQHGESYYFRLTAGYEFSDSMIGSLQYALISNRNLFGANGYVSNSLSVRLRKTF